MEYTATCEAGHDNVTTSRLWLAPAATGLDRDGRQWDEYVCSAEHCGLAIFYPAYDEVHDVRVEVRPSQDDEASAERTFLVRDTRREIDALEEDLGLSEWVDVVAVRFHTADEVRDECGLT
jgi:hypothetical protein